MMRLTWARHTLLLGAEGHPFLGPGIDTELSSAHALLHPAERVGICTEAKAKLLYLLAMGLRTVLLTSEFLFTNVMERRRRHLQSCKADS